MSKTYYAVYVLERLRDGVEEISKICSSKEEALKYIGEISNGFCGPGCEFKLFELGREIHIEETVVETPQPAKTLKKYDLVDSTRKSRTPNK